MLNNLVATQLWHRLACLEPPGGLLVKIQPEMVDFFWDKLHWVPKAVLFLPREEGGQGLVHLASRAAAFRLQFVKRFLTSSTDLIWRSVACYILRRLGELSLDSAWFFTCFKSLHLETLPPFYHGFFKVCGLLKWTKTDNESLHWLLEEPLICGARLDVSDHSLPGLSRTLYRSKVVNLRQLIHIAGPVLSDAAALASTLKVTSVRLTEKALNLWKARLLSNERTLIIKYSRGETIPNLSDEFPDFSLSPILMNSAGPLLQFKNPDEQTLHRANKQIFYRICVKAINAKNLSRRQPTVWWNRLGGQNPQWLNLYSPPLKKRTGDL